MTDNQNKSFPVEKVSRSYNTALLLMAVLIIAAGGLHYTLLNRQKNLTLVETVAQQQFALTQRIAMLVTEHQKTHDERYLSALKDAASAALTNYTAIAPLILSPSAHGVLSDGTPIQTNDFAVALHSFIDKSFTYAVSPAGDGVQASAETLIASAQQDIPDQWNAEVASYVADQQRENDLLGKASLGLYALMLFLLGYEFSALVSPALKRIAHQQENLAHLAATDMLTGTYNRPMLFKVAAMLISSAKRQKNEITALAIDIDDFKKINDAHGRAAGDAALKVIAGTLSEVLRNSDAMGRVGGGEFAVFLPSTDEYHATYVAEKLRAAVEAAPFSVKDTVILLRVSIGIAAMQAHHKTPDDLLRAAEAALHHAKDTGRNRVVTSGSMKEGAEVKSP